uniref:Zinc finger and BTB domain-containing protein 25 n=1 Tax=Equus caballus TaxID=9796 RepID=A0A9L0TUQ5_HORSE|nr:PREDICTED: zinc finger and BTB domain-containing protein 25 isoform X1 [Equus przewalskii]XP_008531464.1 PREDICTED: zinc finger and BTB domain-containing protein 25 isoform X1 [Equus przewalskii]XP_008531465.1 PREDICTED: zinc finger and BTB domain-containing protein 25 isoform X1 [Equus przewalskii]XP_008531466.1 PREDICTED: zinc finger and BTB domain-containing protein 25 isoform X1 [Equus przewalskii]XP_008531467.1 PREDICTED: zinc finger and BTB domain-containing protein 25 isoform X1 [Equu
MDTASHSLVLLQQLNMQREFGFLCDCTVAIGDVYFKAHRAVLAAFSNYFKMIFIHQTSECIKIQPTDIQPDIFSYLLHIMYTGKGPKQIVDHSRLEEGIRFLHADYLSHIATEMNQVFSPETVQSSNLYGIQISTTQKTAVKQGLEVKEAPSNNSGNRAAVQGDHPQLQLSLAIGLDDGTADQQRAHPAAQALEEHQKPPVSIKQERCDPESVISQSHPSPSSEVTGPTFTESSIKIHLCHYCGERFDSRSNLRQHLHTHVSGSLPFGVPASILESNDLGEVHPLNETSEALECRRLSSFIVKENEQQPDHSNRGTTEPLQISQVSLISKDTEPVELNCNFSFSRKRKITCTICGHKFLRKSQLLEHMYTHKEKHGGEGQRLPEKSSDSPPAPDADEASSRRKASLLARRAVAGASAQQKVLKKESAGGVEQITQLQAIRRIIMTRNPKSHFPQKRRKKEKAKGNSCF